MPGRSSTACESVLTNFRKNTNFIHIKLSPEPPWAYFLLTERPKNHNCYDLPQPIDEQNRVGKIMAYMIEEVFILVLYTGDIHGQVTRVVNAIQRFHLGKDDVIVIMGDVGLNYYGNDYGDWGRKKKLNSKGVPILCIHGNHERRPATIESYSITEWHGGKVYVEERFPNLLFAMDGEVYDLDGYKAIAIGGAYSVDKYYRLLRGIHWFPDEQPDEATKARVEEKLEELGWKVDLVLSHTCPTRFVPVEAFLPGLDQSTVDNSTEEWLDTIAERLDYGRWFCGHWHIDKKLGRFIFLMNSFETYDGRVAGENG